MSTTAFRTGNPALSQTAFKRAREENPVPAATMTLGGTIAKTFILVGILLTTAAFTWSQTLVPLPAVDTAGAAASGSELYAVAETVWVYVITGCLGGFVMALVTIFVPRVSPWTSPVYAALEGMALGGLSALMEAAMPGIVLQAVALTLGVLVSMLVVYATGLVHVSQGFRAGVVAATCGICLVYLVDWVLHMFGARVPFIHEGGPIGIAVSVFVVVIAALNLVLDFALITDNINAGAPRYMEWYCGFGLLVTLVWLYIEILRLLAKIRASES
jgi:uncharacterized YccA/Bax inhibitor family protein